MKALTLKEIQQLSLEILIDVDRFCRKHSIKYSLGYGTLLGAVRHKGFIPWDDDIDIMMSRDEYERFRSLYKSDNFRFIDSSVIHDCYISFGRVVDTKRTISKSSIPWHGDSFEGGLWIDIFPIDRVSDNKEEFLNLFTALQILQSESTLLRRIHAKNEDHFKLNKRVLNHLTQLTHPRKMKVSPAEAAQSRNELIRLSSRQDSSHVSQLGCTEDKPEYFDAADILEFTDYEFEGKMFLGWKNFDSILKVTFGDYMVLPPENQRKPRQSYLRFLWK